MPESGVPLELIEEDDIRDYAFVGDITEVKKNYSVLSHPGLLIHPHSDHFNGKLKHSSQSLYRRFWCYRRI